MEEDGLILNFTTNSDDKPTKIIPNKKLKGTWKEKRKVKLQLARKAGIIRKKKPVEVEEDAFRPPAELLMQVDKPITSLNDGKNKISNKSNNKKVDEVKQVKSKSNLPIYNAEEEEDSELDIFDKVEIAEAKSQKSIVSSLFTKNPTIGREHLKSHFNENQISSNGVINNAFTFEALRLDAALCTHLKTKMKVSKPTTIQSKTISFFQKHFNRDAVIQAQTGSGKTLAFLLPIVHGLIQASSIINPPDSFKPNRTIGLISVILAPTRELAHQIYNVLNNLLNYPAITDDQFRRSHWIVPGLVVGGENKSSEKSRIRKGINILIATPGRFLDHLQNTKAINVDQLKWIILDEGDRFLELGLQETLKKIFDILKEKQNKVKYNNIKGSWFFNSKWLPKSRQTILVSATLNSAVEKLAEYSLTNPIHLSSKNNNNEEDSDDSDLDDDTQLDGNNKSYSTPNQLVQSYIAVPAKLRLVALTCLLKKAAINKSGKIVVFMLTCEQVEFYYELFTKAIMDNDDSEDSNEDEKIETETNNILGDIPLFKLHGNMDQTSRSSTFQRYSKLDQGVLFCTDVAARGLDMPKVAQIIQFDPPADVKDYVHRVGRTARLGKAGDAVLFLLPSEIEYLDLLKQLKIYLTTRSLEESLKGLLDEGKGDYQMEATKHQNALERAVLKDNELQQRARKAYLSSIRAYATHSSSEKHIFHIKRLHLGHIAKSFALREAPSTAIQGNRKSEKDKGKDNKRAKSYASNHIKKLQDASGEFAIGSLNKKFRK